MVNRVSDSDFYKLKEIMPAIYGKYIIVKGSHTDCVLERLFLVADAIILCRKRWAGYNIFVDWYDGKTNPFYTYFKLNIVNEFATNYSDMPLDTRSSIYETPIDRNALNSGPNSDLLKYRCVIYDDEYDLSLQSDSTYNLMFQNVLKNSIRPLWNLGKVARGYNRDKYRSKYTVGFDTTGITEDNYESSVSYVDNLLLSNLKSRVFLTGYGSKYFNTILSRYTARASFRKPRYDDPNQDSLLSAIQISLCNFLVGSNRSYVYNYAKNFYSLEDIHTV